MLNAPNRRNQLGLNILALLKAVGPILHPSIYEMWDTALPKLVTFLESMFYFIFLVLTNFLANSDPENWNPSLWEDLILRLTSETIKIANDDEWTVQLGENYAKQIELYKNDADLKRICFKH